jgi:lipoic acid synthetase
MILGNICTRNCSYCSVEFGNPKSNIDNKDIDNILRAIKTLDLKYVVITSPARDDLKDGGANEFFRITQKIKELDSSIKVELLIPDFKNSQKLIDMVANSGAEVIGHNIETIKRRYDIRGTYKYKESLDVLQKLSQNKNITTKSGIMVGFGESEDEIKELLEDLFRAGCRFVSIGQYLAPLGNYERVVEYVKPERFIKYKQIAYSIGFLFVHSSPYTRSSYMAHSYLESSQTTQ